MAAPALRVRCPDVAWHQLGHVVQMVSKSPLSVFPEHRRSFHVDAASASFSGREGEGGGREKSVATDALLSGL